MQAEVTITVVRTNGKIIPHIALEGAPHDELPNSETLFSIKEVVPEGSIIHFLTEKAFREVLKQGLIADPKDFYC